MTSKLDVRRAALAAVAGLIAIPAAAAAWADAGMAGHGLVADVFLIEAIVAAAFVVVPSRARWSSRRRLYARIFANASIVTGIAIVLFTGARAACGCGDPSTGYLLPTVLWITSTTWVDIGVFGVPLLIAIAASDVPYGSPPPRRI